MTGVAGEVDDAADAPAGRAAASRGRQVRAGVAAARARTPRGTVARGVARAAAIPADRRAEIPVKSANPFLSG